MADAPTHVDLSAEQRDLLTELLDEAYRNLRAEIHRTDDYEYKEGLKARQQALLSLLDKLGAHPA
jgi:hypothetical protein